MMNNSTIEGLRAQRDALLEALKASKRSTIYRCKPAEIVLWDDISQLITTIEALPKEGNGWIAVGERWPEDMQKVLVTGWEWNDPTTGKRFHVVTQFSAKDKKFHSWVSDESEEGGYWSESDDTYATHWQPLPHPPKQEEVKHEDQ